MDQFKAIESVRMSVKHAKRKKEMGKKIDPGRARLGKKIDKLVVYTSLICLLLYLFTLIYSYTTGCFRFIVKMFELIAQARKQPISSDR